MAATPKHNAAMGRSQIEIPAPEHFRCLPAAPGLTLCILHINMAVPKMRVGVVLRQRLGTGERGDGPTRPSPEIWWGGVQCRLMGWGGVGQGVVWWGGVGWGAVPSDGVGWGGVGWGGVGWGGVGWGGVGWGGVGWGGVGWGGVPSSGAGRGGVGCSAVWWGGVGWGGAARGREPASCGVRFRAVTCRRIPLPASSNTKRIEATQITKKTARSNHRAIMSFAQKMRKGLPGENRHREFPALISTCFTLALRMASMKEPPSSDGSGGTRSVGDDRTSFFCSRIWSFLFVCGCAGGRVTVQPRGHWPVDST